MKHLIICALVLFLGTHYLSAQTVLPLSCGETTVNNLVESYTIETGVTHIDIFLRGADGGGGRRDGNICNNPRQEGGGGAEIKARFEVGTGADQLEVGGTLKSFVGRPGGEGSRLCASTQQGPMGGGGGSTAVLYLPPGANPAGTNWIILGVAGGGGGGGRRQAGSYRAGKGGATTPSGDGGCGEQEEGNSCAYPGAGYWCDFSGSPCGEDEGVGRSMVEDRTLNPLRVKLKADSYASNTGGDDVVNESGGDAAGGDGFTGGGGSHQSAGGGGGGFTGGKSEERTEGDGGTSYFTDEISNVVTFMNAGGVGGGTNRNGVVKLETVSDVANAVCPDPPFVSVYTDANGDVQVSKSELIGATTQECDGSVELLIDDLFQQTSGEIIDTYDFDCNDISGVFQLTNNVKDADGTVVSTCQMFLDIIDSIPPVAIAQDITVTLNANGKAFISAGQIDNGSSDECGISLRTVSPKSFDCSNIGANTVTLTVYDNNPVENIATATATVTVVHNNLIPSAVCNDVTIYLDANGMASVTAAEIGAGSTDDCGIKSMTLSKTDFDCSDIGTNQTTLTIEDFDGATGGCNAFVYVQDTLPPIAVCNDLTIELDNNGEASLDSAAFVNSASDNCGGMLNVMIDATSFDCSHVGQNTVTLTVEDEQNLITTCTGNVTVEDNIDPQITCKNATVVLDPNGSYSLTAADLLSATSDNCDNPSLQNADPAMVICADVGSQVNVNVTVDDGNGNTVNCTSVITVDFVQPLCLAGTRLWTGTIDSDWFNPCNWNPTCVPTNNDDVEIVASPNDPVIPASTNAAANQVDVKANSSLIVEANATLAIEGMAGGGLINRGTVTNNGIIDIDINFTAAIAILGNNPVLNNNGTINIGQKTGLILGNGISTYSNSVINNTGTINIDDLEEDGLYLSYGSVFNNTGFINIGLNNGSNYDRGIVTDLGAVFYHNGGIINIDNTSGSGILHEGDMFNNNATLNIGTTFGNIDANGINHTAPFKNLSSGIINIDGANLGIHARKAFENYGLVNIGQGNFPIGGVGILSKVSLKNHPGAQIIIDNTGGNGIVVEAGPVMNMGLVDIGMNGGANNIDGNGIFHNGGTFTNDDSGGINIGNTTQSGIESQAKFENLGAINIGKNNSPVNNGLLILDPFNNNTGGNIEIENAISRGISMTSSTLDNKGNIKIGVTGGNNIGLDGVFCQSCNIENEGQIVIDNTSFAAIQNNGGDIVNGLCAEIILFKNLINNDNGSTLTSVFNQGLISIDSDANSVIGYGMNEGIIADIQGTVSFSPNDFMNNEIIIAPSTGDCNSIISAFDTGVPIDLDVTDVFTDENATMVAGDYVEFANVFDHDLGLGQFTLYVEVEDPVNGCTRIVPWNVTLEDNTPPLVDCEDRIIQLGAIGSYTFTEYDLLDGTFDACGDVTFQSSSITMVDCSMAGTTIPVTVTVNDGNGNSANCIANVTVFDNLPPDPTCKYLTVTLNPNGNYTLLESDLLVTPIEDNCLGATFTSASPSVVSCADAGSPVDVIVTVEDNNGNTATCTSVVTVQLGTPVCSSGIRTWTGAIDNDWSTPCNWNPTCVPTINDDVIIPVAATVPRIKDNFTAFAKSVEVEANHSLAIDPGSSLTINDASTDGLKIGGSVNNSGTINIDNTGGNGVDILDGASLFNTGNINIGQNGGNIGTDGINALGGFFFNNSGVLNIDNTGDDGIESGFFNNSATVNIGQNAGNVLGEGIYVRGVFSNNSNSTINIDNVSQSGMFVRREAINYGEINIGQGAGNIADNGMMLLADFTNFSGAIINIDNVEDIGISAGSGALNNQGNIFIGLNGGPDNIGDWGINPSGSPVNNQTGGEIVIANTGEYAIVNENIYDNNVCAVTRIYGPILNNDDLTNFGLFILDTPEPSDISSGTFTNGGIVGDVQGTLPTNTAPFVNNEIVISPTTGECDSVDPAFELGGNVDLNILGVFTDESATTSAGAYEVATNTFTPSIGVGQYNLYVQVEDFKNSCTRVIPWTVTLTDATPPTPVCENPTVQLDENGNHILDGNLLFGGGTDNCGAVFFESMNPTSVDCTNLGSPVSITVTAIDEAGNTATCISTVTVTDETDPVPACKNATVTPDADGSYTLLGSDLIASINDNCNGGAFQSAVPATVSCSDLFKQVTVTATVNDGNGNTGTCTSVVTVMPGTPICSPGLRTWTGAVDSDWHTPCNWMPTCVPTLGDNVFISAAPNNPVIEAGSMAEVLQIILDQAGSLKIEEAAVLNINGPIQSGIESDGSIINNGTINIDDTGEDGIFMQQNASLYNSGFINIGLNTGDIRRNGIYNLNGEIVNGSTAQINIGNTTESGIRNVGPFDNYGQVNIGQNNASIGLIGFFAEASFTNHPGAQIKVDNVGLIGFLFQGGFTTNQGNIYIGQNGGPENVQSGIVIEYAGLINEGFIHIVNVKESGILNDDGTLTNEACAEIKVNARVVNPSVTGPITNNGLFLIDSDDMSTSNNFINNGVFADVQGTFPTVGAGFINNEIIITPATGECDSVNPAFGLGTTVDFNVLGVYTDANASNSAGTYFVGTNDFTPGLGLGQFDLYVKVEDPTNDCTRIVPWKVNLEDTTPPVPACLNPTVSLNTNGSYSLLENDVFGGGNDNCGAISFVSMSPVSVDCDDIGTAVSVTVTAQDANGNQNTCTASVMVVDDEAPQLTCLMPTVTLNANGSYQLTESEVFGGGNDNCGVVTFVGMSQTTVDCGNVGTPVEVIVTANDVKGNQNTCISTVTVIDNVSPVANCQNVTAQLDGNGNVTITASQVNNGSSDACGLATMVLDVTSFTCDNLGGNTVTLTVTDVNGNMDDCQSTVTIQDETAPTALCRPHTVQLGTNGNGSLSAADIDDGSTDACGGVALSVDLTSFNCQDIGQNMVTLTVTDGTGNSSSCQSTVTVLDNVAPTAVCKPISIELDANGQASLVAVQVDGGSGDNCSFSLDIDVISFTCGNLGANSVTLTATDDSGNSHSCEAEVTVLDAIVPTAVCQGATIQLDENGEASTSVNDIDAGSSDNCGIASAVLSMENFTCSDLGGNLVTLTVADASGLTSSCETTVTVVDEITPDLVCKNITVELDATGNVSIIPADVFDDINSSDNCGTINLFNVSTTQFDCSDIGDNEVTLTAGDGNGNGADCIAIVTVEEFIAGFGASSTPEQCGMGNGSITVTASSPGGQLAYSIDNGASWQFTNVFTNLTAGTYEVLVQANGTPGCSSPMLSVEVGQDGIPVTWYKDIDGDGYTDGITLTQCFQPNGFVASAQPGDCNDHDANEFPGQTWYEDLDDDGYGSGNTITACLRPTGCYLASELLYIDTDCNDNDEEVHPFAPEVCNGIDDDCDGQIDEGVSVTYVGNVFLPNQAAVDAWPSCYTVIDGDLLIQNSNVENLDALINLVEVTGYVKIKSTSVLDLLGLANLKVVGNDFIVQSNLDLETLQGLEQLDTVGNDIKVYFNRDLTDCCAIHGLLNNEAPRHFGGNSTILRNETGCDSETEVNNNCSGGSNLIAPTGGSNVTGQACSDCGTFSEELDVDVYPNPASGWVNLGLPKTEGQGTVSISDVTGRLVHTIIVEEGTQNLKVDLRGWRDGLYIVKFESEGGSLIAKRLMVNN